MNDVNETGMLLDLVRADDQRALGDVLERYRSRLERVVRFRIDRRLIGRIDAADVLQDAFLEATTRIKDYLADPKMPFFLWLRFITVQRLMILHRRHLQTKSRDAGREVSLQAAGTFETTSANLATYLADNNTSPSQACANAELKLQIQESLDKMDDIDKEVLALRHFEQLSNAEVSRVLDISKTAASNRYIRAVKRLGALLNPANPEST